MAKGRNYKITGALETHPKAIPLKFEIEFGAIKSLWTFM